jgi:hypothetical protein
MDGWLDGWMDGKERESYIRYDDNYVLDQHA